jgi:hypothetical protein
VTVDRATAAKIKKGAICIAPWNPENRSRLLLFLGWLLLRCFLRRHFSILLFRAQLLRNEQHFVAIVPMYTKRKNNCQEKK